MWKTELYETWIRISDDAIVNARNVVAVERRVWKYRGEEREGVWVHVGGAKIKGTITLEEWSEALEGRDGDDH